MTTPDLQALIELNRLYATAYAHGHHDTVEGQYTDVDRADVDDYFAENVAEFLADANHTAPTLPGAGGGDALDAARYRWLRNEGHPDSDNGLCVAMEGWNTWGKPFTQYPVGAELDELIDAALPPQQGG